MTGSHKYSCLFSAISLDGKQLFKQYDKFDIITFLDFLKTINLKFPKCYPFKDKSSPPPIQISEGEGLHRKENGYSYPRVSSNSVPRVYDTRRGMEYSKTGSACFESLLTL
jgi:hypothetical protein